MPVSHGVHAPPSVETWTSKLRMAESSEARQPTTNPASPVRGTMTTMPASGGVVSWRYFREIAPYSSGRVPS